MKYLLRRAFATSVAIVVASAAHAQTATFDIPAGDLKRALDQFSRQSQMQLLFRPSEVRGVRTRGVQGTMPAEEALRRLLLSSGFRLERDPSGAYAIVRDVVPEEARNVAVESDEEIIVTAQKREQRLIDVPVPVTAVSSEALVDSNAHRVQDYYHRVPGLSLTTVGNGNESVVAIRGVTTGGAGNPTVGVVVDDVPFGPSITTATMPDIDPSSLSRIEVLRGPQGSLYGASSMGGLIKFVTISPSTSEFGGSAEAGISGVDRSEEVGYSFRGALNVPLGDTAAIRASGYYRFDPGYVDNVATGLRDVNDTRAKGLHASLLWEPSSTFSVRVGALVQNSRRSASDEVNLTLGEDAFRHSDLPFTGIYSQRAEVYSAVVKGSIGDVDITSISAYNYSYLYNQLDLSPLAGGVFSALANQFFGTPDVYLPFFTKTKAYTQELRVNVPLGPRLNWLIGGLVDHEDILFGNQTDAFDTATGASIGTLVKSTITQKYRNHALFSNLDLTLSDRFSIQLGGRLSTNRQRSRTVRSGALIELGGAPIIDSGVMKSSESPFTFSIAPQWRIRPDLMLYARVASGYRPGGPNVNCGGSPEVACSFGSDSTVNYELGLKGNLLDRRLTIDASAYRIDWKDIQTLLFTSTRLGYMANGTQARSQGVEISLAARPTRTTSVDAWIAYNDSELTEDFPASAGLFAFEGDRLPYSSRWSGNISLRQEFAVTERIGAFVGGSLSYVGDRSGAFQPIPVRSQFPDYWQLDFNGGVSLGDWRVNAFVTNVTNERGILRSGADSNVPNFVTYMRPRTFGMLVSRSF